MARHRELNNVAAGLLSSFVSRNNDVAGYWGIGQLCELADRVQLPTVQLDLVACSIFPNEPKFNKLVHGYSRRLAHHLEKCKIPSQLVVSATIDLDFQPTIPDGTFIPITTWGKVYRATVKIFDNRNRPHAASTFGYCAPHDPKRESRSAGVERY